MIQKGILQNPLGPSKAQEREFEIFDENRRAVGMLNPLGDRNEGTYRGGEDDIYALSKRCKVEMRYFEATH